MSDEKDVETIVSGIEEGLKTHSIKEFSRAIVTVLNKNREKHEEIENVLTIVCNEYSVSRKVLMSRSMAGDAPQARKMAYCLLHFCLDIRAYHISKKIFDKANNGIMVAIQYYKNLDEKIKPDREFKERFEKLQSKIVK